MSVSIDWLNQWLPFAKWLTVAALLFSFPLLLEACNRLRWRPLALSASQRHDVWGIALIVWAMSLILGFHEVRWSIPISATGPATGVSRSASDFDLPPNRIPLTSNEAISAEFKLGEETEKFLEMEHLITLDAKPLLERMETEDRPGSSSLNAILGWRHFWLGLYAGGTVLLLIRLVRAHGVATALARSAELVCESKCIGDLRGKCSISNEIRFGWSESTRMDQGNEIAIQLRTSIQDLRLEDSMLQIFGNNSYVHPDFDSSGYAR